MKLVVAIFALVSLCGVSGSNPQINDAWVRGARTVDAPLIEVALSGEQVKEDIISSVNKYLSTLDSEFSRLYGTWAYEVQSRCSGYHKEIEDKKIQIQIGGYADFTNELAALANEYRIITNGINGEERMSLNHIQRAGLNLHHLLAPNSRLVAGAPRYSLEEQFFSYKKVILERDFEILRNFLLNLLKAGYQNVSANSSRMEKNHRLDNLWPLVTSLQEQSHSIENDQKILEAYTNPSVFKEYIKARTVLWDIYVPQKINEDKQ